MGGQKEISDRSPARLTRDGIRALVGTALAPIIKGGLLFAAAGTFALPRGWYFVILCFVGTFSQTALLAAVNPELVNRRGQRKMRRDIEGWDRRILGIYALTALCVTPLIIGLDVGRYRWSSLGTWSTIVGTTLFALGTVCIGWAMLVNTHFEVTVRIQRDRGHKVVTTGPYAFIRHPGYVGGSLWVLSAPLLVGSAFGLIPAVIATAALAVRARREDTLLHHELPGYADYAAKVRYRFIPHIW